LKYYKKQLEQENLVTEKVAEEQQYNSLFGEVRGFTKEESKLYEESLAEMFKPTGINFFEEQEQELVGKTNYWNKKRKEE
jgi:hypothetical protein